MVPKLMKSPKWSDTKSSLQIGNIVYFRQVENELSSDWSLGKVVGVTFSRDGIIRRCSIEYQNANESIKRQTDRAVRSLIKLSHIDDNSWTQEMFQLEILIESLDVTNDSIIQDKCNTSLVVKLCAWVKFKKNPCKLCRCHVHCSIESHGRSAKCYVMV